MVLTLFLLVFVSNHNSTSFTKDFQQIGFVCELDIDSDAFNEESAANFLDHFLLVCNQLALINNLGSICADLPISGDNLKGYLLNFSKEQRVVFHKPKFDYYSSSVMRLLSLTFGFSI